MFCFENCSLTWNGRQIAYMDRESLAFKDIYFDVRADKPVILIHQIMFTLKSNAVYPYWWDAATAEVEFAKEGPDSCRITVGAYNPDADMHCTGEMRVRHSRGKFTYTVSQTLKVLKDFSYDPYEYEVNGRTYYELEITDPYPKYIVPVSDGNDDAYYLGHYLPGSAMPSAERKADYRYLRLPDGKLLPLQHYVGVPAFEVRVGQTVSFVGRREIVYKVLDKSDVPLYSSLCYWGYDLHFLFLNQARSLRSGDRFYITYTVSQMPADPVDKDDLIDIQYPELPVYRDGYIDFSLSAGPDTYQCFPFAITGGRYLKGEREVVLDAGGSLGATVGQEMFGKNIYAGNTYALEIEAIGHGRVTLTLNAYKYPGKHGEIGNTVTASVGFDSQTSDTFKVEAVAPRHVCSASLSVSCQSGTAVIRGLRFYRV